jgi:hypothetical protein
MDINDLIATFNGSAFVEAGHQEWGYVPLEWHLAIPDEVRLLKEGTDSEKKLHDYWQTFHIGESFFYEENTNVGICSRENFIKANYQLLASSGVTQSTALIITMMRLALAQQGAIALSLHRRSVAVDEYTYVAHKGDSWKNAANNIPTIERHKEIAAWTKRFSGVLVSHIVFLFLARGHHYLPEYNEIYQKLYKACFISDPVGFALPIPEQLYRLSVHCFGVLPLLEFMMQQKLAGRMAAAMNIRYTPHAPIAGVAQFTTLAAAFQDMRRHALWTKVETYFAEPLALLREVCSLIHASPYKFHVASKVLAAGPRVIPDAKYYEAFQKLAACALGYIDYLGKKHSLAGQKAITQKYGGMDPAADMWSRAFDEYGLPSARDLDVDEFFATLREDRDFMTQNKRLTLLKRQTEYDNAILERKKKELEVQKLEKEVTSADPTFTLGEVPH